MQKGIQPGTEKRNALLRFFIDTDTQPSIANKLIEPMIDKSDEEKEKIAERILEELMEAERYNPKTEYSR